MTGSTGGQESRAASTEIRDNEFQGPAPTHTGSGLQNNYFTTVSAERRERVLAGLPPEPAGFVGRSAQVDEALEVLRPGSGADAVVVCAVGGLAGVGKSALAIHAARRAVAEGYFHDGVWLNLRGFDLHAAPLEPAGAVPVLLRALGWDADVPAGIDEQLALYHAVLAGLAKQSQRVLVVLDNVVDTMQIDGLLTGHQMHRVMVTSRTSLASLGARMVDLDVLDAAEAVALLATALRDARPNDPRANDGQALGEVAAACGRLPLALQIAAALLKASPNRPVDSLARQLADERARLETLRFPDSTLRPGIRAALHLSYNRLTGREARMLRLLSIDPGPNIAAAAAAALAGVPGHQAEGSLYALEVAHLVACDEHGRWSMHDLVRLYARDLLKAEPAERAAARDRLFGYYMETADAADDHLRALPGQPAVRAFAGRLAALEWLDANRANLVATVQLAARSERLDIAMRLPPLLAVYFEWRRLIPEWIESHTVAVAAARTLGNRRGEGTALNNLGLALQEVRRFDEAIDAQQRAAAISREAGDRRGEGMALNNLGTALQEVGRFEEAIEAQQQAVAILREGGDRHGTGMALGNLGLALQEVGRFEEAIEAHQQAAAILQVGDRHGEGVALNNLGLALREAGRFEESIEAQQRAAAILREAGDPHREGVALGNLGLALREVGRFEEAIQAQQRAAAIHRETGGSGYVSVSAKCRARHREP